MHTHQSLRVEADTIAAAHDMRAGESLLLPMPITHVAGLTYGVLLPVTSGDHRGADGHVGARPRARARRARAHRGDDQHAGVHAHDDRPPRVRRHRHVVGAAVLARRRGRRARDGARGRAALRLLVQAHVRLDRVPDAHHRPARRRSRARRDHRRLPDRPGRAAHRRPADARRRRARRARRAARAGPEMFVGYLDPALDAERVRCAADGSAPAISRATTASTSPSSIA